MSADILDAASLDDPTTLPFWAGTFAGELRLQRCVQCRAYQFPPRPFCLDCGSEPEWVTASGRGTIYSLTTVRMQVSPLWPPPYTVAIIDLDEGPRFLAQLRGEVNAIGQRVVARFEPRLDAPPLVVFSREVP